MGKSDSGRQRYFNYYHEDVINLKEYIDIIVKRKVTIVAVLLVCVFCATIWCFATPRVYSVAEILAPPIIDIVADESQPSKLGAKYVYLDTAENMKEKVEAGTYNMRIKRALSLSLEKPLAFRVAQPRKGNFIKVSINVVEDEVDYGIRVLQGLYEELVAEYSSAINNKSQMIDNELKVIQNKLEQAEADRAAIEKTMVERLRTIEHKGDESAILEAKVALLDSRLASLSDELSRAHVTLQALVGNEAMRTRKRANEESMTFLAEASHVQQSIFLYNSLTDQGRSFILEKKAIENDIKVLKKEIANVLREVQMLHQYQTEQMTRDIETYQLELDSARIKKAFIQNVQQLQLPQRSERPIRPKKVITVGVAMIVGLLLGLGIAVGREAIEKSEHEQEGQSRE